MSNVALKCRQDDIVATFSSRGVNDTGIKLSMYRKICTLYRVVLKVFGIGWVSLGRCQGYHFLRKKIPKDFVCEQKIYCYYSSDKDNLTYTCTNVDTLSLQICKFIL